MVQNLDMVNIKVTIQKDKRKRTLHIKETGKMIDLMDLGLEILLLINTKTLLNKIMSQIKPKLIINTSDNGLKVQGLDVVN
jgi:hypothetical protein